MKARVLPLAVAWALTSSSASAAVPDGERAEAPLYFVVAPRWGMEAGIRSTHSLGQLVFGYDEPLRAWWPGDESTPAGKGVSIAGRVAKGLFLDVPLAAYEGLVVHEVFGHGARLREIGEPAQFEFRLVFPYNLLFGQTGGSGRTNGLVKDPERRLPMVAGGFEANQLTAAWIASRICDRGGYAPYNELMTYVGSRLNYALDFYPDWSRTQSERDGRDIGAYVTGLAGRFNRWRPEERERIGLRLRVAHLSVALDPALWLSTYHFFVTYLVKGERSAKLPAIPLGQWRVFPSTRFNLSPFGAEHYLDVSARADRHRLSAYLRLGSSGLASYWGTGAGLHRYQPWSNVLLSAEVDLWAQPALLFGVRNVYVRKNLPGAGVAAQLEWRFHSALWAVAKVGFKSRGYVMGQPLESGFHGFAGLALELEHRGER